jgi:hypothetical protein
LISVVTQYGSFQVSLALFPLAFLLAFGVLFWQIQPGAREERAWSAE